MLAFGDGIELVGIEAERDRHVSERGACGGEAGLGCCCPFGSAVLVVVVAGACGSGLGVDAGSLSEKLGALGREVVAVEQREELSGLDGVASADEDCRDLSADLGADAARRVRRRSSRIVRRCG